MPDTRTNEEVSAEVARRLFGWEWRQVHCFKGHLVDAFLPTERGSENLDWCHAPWNADTDGLWFVKPYASEHNAALGLVVPEMTAQGFEFRMIVHRSDGSVFVEFYNEHVQAGEMVDSIKEAPRAICEAALAALDAEGGKR